MIRSETNSFSLLKNLKIDAHIWVFMIHLGHMMTGLDNKPSTEHVLYRGKATDITIAVSSGKHLRSDSTFTILDAGT